MSHLRTRHRIGTSQDTVSQYRTWRRKRRARRRIAGWYPAVAMTLRRAAAIRAAESSSTGSAIRTVSTGHGVASA
eukprot:1119498-Rhodomonas_salina.1